MSVSKKTKRLLAAVLVLLLLALAGLVGWRLWKEKQYEKALQTAMEYRDTGRYLEARDLYLSLNLSAEAAECEALSIQQEQKNAYADAEALLASGSFLDAKDAFLALGDYQDAALRAQECDYRRAEDYAQNDRLSEAISLLESLTDYPGAKELMNACRDTLYDRALEATYACRLDEMHHARTYPWMVSAAGTSMAACLPCSNAYFATGT